MPRIGGHRERSKIANLWRFNRYIDNRCLAPPTNDGDGDGDVDGLTRRYRLLPRQELIDLFVLKLDGSVFDVRVARSCTVADVKRAIEEVFNSPGKEHCKIPWSLVWGHFCLCYEGQKLIDDKACIRIFGIKDGDQLQFIRHMSINYLPVKRDRKNQTVSCKSVLLYSTYTSYKSLSPEIESKSVEENHLPGPEDPYNYEVQDDGSNQEEVPTAGFQLANFFRGRLLYSRIWGFLKSASEGRNRHSGFFIT